MPTASSHLPSPPSLPSPHFPHFPRLSRLVEEKLPGNAGPIGRGARTFTFSGNGLDRVSHSSLSSIHLPPFALREISGDESFDSFFSDIGEPTPSADEQNTIAFDAHILTTRFKGRKKTSIEAESQISMSLSESARLRDSYLAEEHKKEDFIIERESHIVSLASKIDSLSLDENDFIALHVLVFYITKLEFHLVTKFSSFCSSQPFLKLYYSLQARSLKTTKEALKQVINCYGNALKGNASLDIDFLDSSLKLINSYIKIKEQKYKTEAIEDPFFGIKTEFLKSILVILRDREIKRDRHNKNYKLLFIVDSQLLDKFLSREQTREENQIYFLLFDYLNEIPSLFDLDFFSVSIISFLSQFGQTHRFEFPFEIHEKELVLESSFSETEYLNPEKQFIKIMEEIRQHIIEDDFWNSREYSPNLTRIQSIENTIRNSDFRGALFYINMILKDFLTEPSSLEIKPEDEADLSRQGIISLQNKKRLREEANLLFSILEKLGVPLFDVLNPEMVVATRSHAETDITPVFETKKLPWVSEIRTVFSAPDFHSGDSLIEFLQKMREKSEEGLFRALCEVYRLLDSEQITLKQVQAKFYALYSSYKSAHKVFHKKQLINQEYTYFSLAFFLSKKTLEEESAPRALLARALNILRIADRVKLLNIKHLDPMEWSLYQFAEDQGLGLTVNTEGLFGEDEDF